MSVLSRWRIGKRSTVAFGIVVILLLVQVGERLSAWSLRSIGTDLQAVQQESHKMGVARDVEETINDILLSLALMTLDANQQRMPQYLVRIEDDRTVYRNGMDELTQATHTEEGRKLLADIRENIGLLKSVDLHLVQSLKEGKQAEASGIFNEKCVPGMAEVSKAVTRYLAWREQRGKQSEAAAQATMSLARTLATSCGAIALVVIVFFGIVITRGITRPLNLMAGFLNTIAQGDISHDVPQDLQGRQDEIGLLARGMQATSDNLRGISPAGRSPDHLVGGTVRLLAADVDRGKRPSEPRWPPPPRR